MYWEPDWGVRLPSLEIYIKSVRCLLVLNNRRLIHNGLLALLLCPVLFTQAPWRAAGAVVIQNGVQMAPAVAPDEADTSQAWKVRLQFRELNLQLIGVATLQDQASCFIKSPGSSEQMIYTVGDVIGGYRIAGIDSQSVTFERQGARFPLRLGQSSGAEPVAAEPAAGDLQTLGAAANVAVKVADSRLKNRTQRYATAKLIEDAATTRLDDGDSPGPRKPFATTGKPFASDFAMPLAGELTSSFGYRRHPLGGGIRYHRGIDLAASEGTPIKAAAAGRVIAVYNSTAHDLGRHLVIQHNDEFETLYGHLSRILVSQGQLVQKGDIIGREGSTGASTGPHLHFEIHRNKEAVNPLPYLHLQ